MELLDRNLEELAATAPGPERAIVETAVFFEAHRLKGAAGTLGLPELAAIAEELAHRFQGARSGEDDIDSAAVAAARRKLDGARAELRAADAAPTSTCTILHVEDDPVISTFVERVLAREPGATLLSASTGAAALRIAREQSPDLVLLDLRLPDMPGGHVFRRLREDPETRGIPVVITTGGGLPGEVERLLAEGAAGCLEKPIDLQALRELVGRFTR